VSIGIILLIVGSAFLAIGIAAAILGEHSYRFTFHTSPKSAYGDYECTCTEIFANKVEMKSHQETERAFGDDSHEWVP
jgi:hypothetical protein